jgi:tetratricopeptide (TPR) repeat protein
VPTHLISEETIIQMQTKLFVKDYRSFRKSFIRTGLFFILTWIQIISPSIGRTENCTEPVGRMVSIQGKIQVRHSNQTGWSSLELEEKICPGDILRAGGNSRAAVALNNESVLRINQNSTLFFPGQQKNQPLVLKILHGIIHIFNHRSRALKVITPFVNGAVEGTEFQIQVSDSQTSINVFKGLVVAANDHGRLNISSGQAIIARKNTAPKYLTIVKPLDATYWTLYYPKIILPLKDSSKKNTIPALIKTAADQLALGQVNKAKINLGKVLLKQQDNSDALALQAIIMVAQNKREAALTLATQAIESGPQTPAAILALSYALQAGFDIDGALTTLQKGSDLNPGNALIKARLAELLLSVGNLENALQAARQAVALDPDIGRTQTVLGFAYLAQMKTDQARSAFERAIALDQVLPLARLGLGLAKIRAGDLEKGRNDIEIAAALDPGNSLIRSYLGKAFFEEKREKRAEEQYTLAKKLDPMDPTPWLYDAIYKQTANRPVEALHDLEKSIDLNDNRAVYRSRLLLDEDLAARSASLGRIFMDLGFQQTALVEGWHSLQTDPANYSAHRLLADSYSSLPRHEIARVSELLLSQLLQPINITPVQPRLAESNLFILEGAGPTRPSFNEFNPLFLRNEFALQSSAVLGNNATFGDELTQSAIWNRNSYSIGQFHYETDGIRENNDQNVNIYNAFVQSQLSFNSSVMAEIRYRKKKYGDLVQRFDSTDYSRTTRQEDETKSFRLGAKYAINNHSTLIGTAIFSDDDNTADGIDYSDGLFLALEGRSDSYMGEIQHIYRDHKINVISGMGYFAADENDTIKVAGLPLVLADEQFDTDHFNVYSYANFNLPYNAQVTAGLSADFLDGPVADKDQLNPKFGLTWQVLKNTTLRAAAFRTLQRRLIYAQTIEPTQVAGFNQLFDDFEASNTWRYGFGLDQKLPNHCFGGFEYAVRELNVPFTSIADTGNIATQEDDWQEQTGKVYFYWPVSSSLTLGTEYDYERLKHDQWEGPEEIRKLVTQRLSPNIRFFHPSGFIGKLQASYIQQEGEFGFSPFGFNNDSDFFWVVDASINYRLPKRFGMLRLEIKNLFDKQFHYLDTDVANPEILPERQITGSFIVSF